ncbi:MAG: 50S ribosomal protein L23 [Prevotellaceae bacterium]|jgi:large subunit ribosomal protein L23|nr:50S ribosomal protein L23 [Prevotellaceae bacterium]
MEIIIKPLSTEKMTIQGDKLNCYGFVVDHRANKIQIKEAIEAIYKVSVERVNTANYHGKTKTRNTKTGFVSGRTNRYKKAFVTLKGDDKIDLFSNI